MAGLDGYVTLLLHMNGADGTTVFTDSSYSKHTVTAVNHAQIDTAQYRWVSSGLFDGIDDCLSIGNIGADFNFGSGDFIIDFWFRTPSDWAYNSEGYIFGADDGTWQNRVHVWIYWQKIQFLITNGGVNIIDLAEISGSITATNTLYHIAAVRYGNNWRIYCNGIMVAETTASGACPDVTQVNIGQMYLDGNIKGWIDELRVSKGIARWIENFNPPISEYDDRSPIMYLLMALRELLCDEKTPYRWQDSAFIRYLNEAEEQACRRAYLLNDATTASICAITVNANQASYLLHSKILYINRLTVDSATEPLTQMTRGTMDKVNVAWISTTGLCSLFFHEANNELILIPTPISATVARLIVARLPLSSFSNGITESPEILPQYHNDLMLWALSKAYEKRLSKSELKPWMKKNTNDTQNMELAAYYENRFTARFGPLTTANMERLKRTLDKKKLRRMIRKGQGVTLPEGTTVKE